MSLKALAKRGVIGAVLVVGPLIGCDDDYYDYPYYASSGGSFGTTGGVSSSGSTYYGDAGAEPCAAHEEGDPCPYNNQQSSCEKGEHANSSCNGYLACRNGAWKSEEPQRAVCAPANVCPATYTETAPADLCQRPDAISLLCEYDEGTCGCAPVDGVTHAKRDGGASDAAADADAGPADAGPRTYEWKCVQPDRDAGCPRRRPREGIQCVRQMHCDYGFCVFEDGLVMGCSTTRSWAREFRSDRCDQ